LAESSPVDDSPTASEAAPLLTFAGVGKRFPDGTTALDGVDLRVPAGEFVSVIGPSGCGKSTLLRIASDLTRASDGTVDIRTRKIGYVFQDPTLLPWRSVQANVELFAELRRLPRRSAADGPTPPSSWSA
jgi:NitT/TauT family transport system ATP-binding protein